MDEVGERLDAVDGDDRDPLAVAPLEVRVGGDIDLLELERDVGADLPEDPPGALAQVAPGGGVERDAAQRLRRRLGGADRQDGRALPARPFAMTGRHGGICPSTSSTGTDRA